MANSSRVVAELKLRCFYARDEAHNAHLATTSFAQHMALGTFYEEMPGLVDDLVESYQGIYGIVEDKPNVTMSSGAMVPILTQLRKWIMDNRDRVGVPDDTELQNDIDAIVSLINRTVYKLKNLK
jgi:hypothetical protein